MESSSPELRRQPALLLQLKPSVGIGLGLLSGALAWGLIRAIDPVFLMPPELYIGMGSPDELVRANQAQQRWLDREHAMLYLGLFGIILGAALAVGECLVERRLRAMAWTIALLSLAGGVGGALGGLLACLSQELVLAWVGVAELQHTAGVQFVLCLPLASWLRLGLSVVRRTQSVSGGGTKGKESGLTNTVGKICTVGLLASLMVAVVYPLFTAIVFPNFGANTLLPIGATHQLVWLSILGAVIGGAIFMGQSTKPLDLQAEPHSVKR